MDRSPFHQVDQVIEQQKLAAKISGMSNTRAERADWAIRDGVSKGLAPEDIIVLTSPYYATPSVSERRKAESLGVNPGTGDLTIDRTSDIVAQRNNRIQNLEDSIRAETEIPEVRPVFLGLRRFITERLMRGTERKIERLKSREAVAAHVGTVVLRNRFYGGYYTKPDNEVLPPPRTRAEKRTTEKLEKLSTKRHNTLTKARQLETLANDTKEVRPKKYGPRVQRTEHYRSRADAIEQKIHSKAFEDHKKINKALKRKVRLEAKREALDSAMV